MKGVLSIILWVFAPMLTQYGLQIGEVKTNNQTIKIMKMNFNNPAWLQGASNVGKSSSLFYVTSNEDGNEINFANTKLGAHAENVQYSTDGGVTWEQLTQDAVIALDNGETVLFRNYTKQVYDGAMGTNVLKTSDAYSVGGNIIALFYPNNTLPNSAFKEAFENDTHLQDASELQLPATSLAGSCYNSMFSECTSLTAAPELPATSLAKSCYNSMFYRCTSLTAAPELPATSLAESCYSNMFYGCSSLTAAPELPATSLAESCYISMFSECTSLTAAPELPATSLADYCYSSMFYGCTSLTAVTCLATDISANNCTVGWLEGVAGSGFFTKAADMTDWQTGSDGIPDGWTVQDYVQ